MGDVPARAWRTDIRGSRRHPHPRPELGLGYPPCPTVCVSRFEMSSESSAELSSICSQARHLSPPISLGRLKSAVSCSASGEERNVGGELRDREDVAVVGKGASHGTAQ